MTFKASLRLASAAITVAALLVPPVQAADLSSWGRGSIKDYTPMPAAAPASPCYFRADVGYSLSGEPEMRWAQSVGNVFVTEKVGNTSVDDTWVAEAGLGCGSGSRGLRGEVVLGYRGDRDVTGTTGPWDAGGVTSSAKITAPLDTYTTMVNVFADLGQWRGMVPYLGVGMGVAYHRMGDMTFSGHPGAVGGINGNSDLTFAWSAMAGVGYQISDRAIFDIGYRYIDLGKATTAATSTTGLSWQPRMTTDDITAHEIKIGLRYHLGGNTNCCGHHRPMK